MSRQSRRTLLKSGLALSAGALAAGGAPARAQGAAPVKTVLAVPPTTIAIAGTSDVFPVRRIYCIGRNYAAHAREMGSDPNREPPFLA